MTVKRKNKTVPDPDLEIRGGRQSSRPLGKGGGGDLQKTFFWPFGPQFGLKLRGGGAGPLGPFPGSATEKMFKNSVVIAQLE